jgi:hypothetical protein
VRPAGRMVSAVPGAWTCRAVAFTGRPRGNFAAECSWHWMPRGPATTPTFEPVSANPSLRFRETGFRGQRLRHPNAPRGPFRLSAETPRPQISRPIRGISLAARKSPRPRECVVDDAVLIEPVFNPNSLITGKLTGNFSNSGLFLRFSSLINEGIQSLPEKFPTKWNREFF